MHDTLTQFLSFRLQRFEKTNAMLSNCNSLSATRFERAMNDFKRHTLQVNELKKDLDIVLRKIHSIKSKLAIQNPEAYQGIFVTQKWYNMENRLI